MDIIIGIVLLVFFVIFMFSIFFGIRDATNELMGYGAKDRHNELMNMLYQIHYNIPEDLSDLEEDFNNTEEDFTDNVIPFRKEK